VALANTMPRYEKVVAHKSKNRIGECILKSVCPRAFLHFLTVFVDSIAIINVFDFKE